MARKRRKRYHEKRAQGFVENVKSQRTSANNSKHLGCESSAWVDTEELVSDVLVQVDGQCDADGSAKTTPTHKDQFSPICAQSQARNDWTE